MSEPTNNSTADAMVIATYSREMDLQLADGDIVRARIKGKKLKPVCGDRVSAEPIPNEPQWLITGIQNRDNELLRPNARGYAEVLAANLDFLCVVAAPAPTADWYIVDRYLCAAELMGADAAVVYNKCDLGELNESAQQALLDYERIGYATLRCSATSGLNIDQLEHELAGHTAIIVGQSGVGKSSLINELIGEDEQRTATISQASGEGRHTTVNSRMLQLTNGGKVIDSPGVRDFAPAIQDSEDVRHSFREIAAAGQDCKFANCRHLQEPGCAVKNGVEDGSISERRYDSYRRLLVLTEQLAKKRGDR